MAELRLQEEEIQHYFEKAQGRLGKREISAEEYEDLGREAEEQEHFFAAANYYNLAESQALPGEKAQYYKEKTIGALRQAEAHSQQSQPD